jgi:hypothetical protein
LNGFQDVNLSKAHISGFSTAIDGKRFSQSKISVSPFELRPTDFELHLATATGAQACYGDWTALTLKSERILHMLQSLRHFIAIYICLSVNEMDVIILSLNTNDFLPNTPYI